MHSVLQEKVVTPTRLSIAVADCFLTVLYTQSLFEVTLRSDTPKFHLMALVDMLSELQAWNSFERFVCELYKTHKMQPFDKRCHPNSYTKHTTFF